MTPPLLLEAASLACGWGGRPVLEDIDLMVRPGEFVGILGPNGAGKSTLIKTLAGVLAPLGGQVRLSGRALGSYDARSLARLRAYLPQEAPPDGGWRVAELVALGRFVHRAGWGLWQTQGDREALASALASTGLDELADRPMHALSGGQRQRAYLARAIAQEAPLLLLDEPTSHLDLSHQLEFFRLVRQLLAKGPGAAVAVLHDLNLAAQFCDRLLVVKGGRLLADGPPDAVLEPGLIAEAFGLQVQVRHHPETGLPYVLPLQLAPRHPATKSGRSGALRHRLHVICGGGAGERLLPDLYRRGYELTVGVVNALDSDQLTASRLGLDVITEAPFSPLAPENLATLASRLRATEAVVIANVAWGAGNVGNLRVLADLPVRPPVFLADDTPLGDRDFTGGEASALIARLVAEGAEAHPSDRLAGALAARGIG